MSRIALNLRIVILGQQSIRELDRRMRGGDFGGVNRAGDHHDHLAFELQPRGFGFGGPARIGEAHLDVAIMLQVLDIRRRGDHRRDLRPPFDRLAELQVLDPVARFPERLKIRDDLVPIQQLVIDADLVAEVTLGIRNGGPERAEQKQA